MDTFNTLTISLTILAAVRLIGALVFLDLFLQKRERKYILLCAGWLTLMAGSAWGLSTHLVRGEMENYWFSLLAGFGTYLVGCGALLYFNAIKYRTIFIGAGLIIAYGTLPLILPNLEIGVSPGVIVQALIALLVTFITLFKRKVFWGFARSSYLWLVALAVLADAQTLAFILGIFGPSNLGLGFCGTAITQFVAIVFFLHLEHSISTRQIRESESRYRTLSKHLEERVAERTLELHEAQEKLVRQEKLAVLGQLSGSVGHELRNPLGVMANAVYFLKLIQPDANEKVNEYLAILEAEIHTSDKIITDLLEFSRTKSADREPTPARELIKRVLERYPAPEGVTVSLKVPASLPPLFVDPGHIEQVFGNLVVNACQAMPAGGRLSLSARRQKDMLAIAVSDTGTGISPENMARLFEPLFTTKTKGTGLGLAVCRRLVEANDGRIEARSELDKGTTFTVTLPIEELARG